MTKKTLTEQVADNAGISKAEAKRQIDAVIAGIAACTSANDDKVIIPGFGTFKRKLRGAKSARNPRTGEPIQVAEKSVLTFKASK